MRISDWSSDVCSSDLASGDRQQLVSRGRRACATGCLGEYRAAQLRSGARPAAGHRRHRHRRPGPQRCDRSRNIGSLAELPHGCCAARRRDRCRHRGIFLKSLIDIVYRSFESFHWIASKPRIMVNLTDARSEEHTSELQSLMRTSYAVFCLKNKTNRLTKATDPNSNDIHNIVITSKAYLQSN